MEQLVNFIIRPPRAEYNPKYDLLEQQFRLRGKLYKRKDVEVKNSRGDILQCSHYMPVVSPEGKPLPCVIYCHGNSGCRVDASETAIVLLPSNITVFALDFSGSGLSGGEHVSLGWYEKDDLKAVVEYLRTEGNVSLIGLWGRSMGAVTSLMYGAEDPSIAGMVLDSPFSDLVDLMMELADTQAFRLPKFTVKLAIQYMRRAIQKKANFDITDLNATKFAKSCFVPVLFGHGIEDDFIRPHHSDRIFESYMGDKNIIKFEGDHNSTRPQFYFDSVNIFFHNVLQPPEDGPSGSVYSSMHDYFGKVDWSNVSPDGGYAHEPSTVSGGPSSVENGSGQTCSRSSPNRAENMENGEVASASSSFNFELSNGHPYGPHVPTIPDDEQYLEYQLDDLSGFPCTAEEEEKMLMEAVLLSLQDVKPPDTKLNSNGECGDEQVKTESPSTSTENATSVSGSERKVEGSSSSTKPPSTSTENATLVSGSERKVEGSSSSTKSPSTSTENATLVSGLERKVEGSSSSSSTASVSVENPSVTETSDSTRTPAVSGDRNPGTQVIDGLVRRWDLSFFKSGRS